MLSQPNCCVTSNLAFSSKNTCRSSRTNPKCMVLTQQSPLWALHGTCVHLDGQRRGRLAEESEFVAVEREKVWVCNAAFWLAGSRESKISFPPSSSYLCLHPLVTRCN